MTRPPARRAATWRFFSEAERRTARALRPLRHEGWAVLHDRAIPGRAGNMDHLVIGPTGVYALDSMLVPDAPVETRNEVLHVGGNAVDLATIAERAEEAWKLLFEEVALTGAPVVPALSLHGARVSKGPQVVGNVDVVGASALRDYLQTTRRPRLGPASVVRLAARARRRLPPAGFATRGGRPAGASSPFGGGS